MLTAQRQRVHAGHFECILDAEPEQPPVEGPISQGLEIETMLGGLVALLVAERFRQRVVAVQAKPCGKALVVLYLQRMVDRTSKVAGVVGGEELWINRDPVLRQTDATRKSADLSRNKVAGVQEIRKTTHVIGG